MLKRQIGVSTRSNISKSFRSARNRRVEQRLSWKASKNMEGESLSLSVNLAHRTLQGGDARSYKHQGPSSGEHAAHAPLDCNSSCCKR
jgi:hypothetical protein